MFLSCPSSLFSPTFVANPLLSPPEPVDSRSPSALPGAMFRLVSVQQMLPQVSCSAELVLGIVTKIAGHK